MVQENKSYFKQTILYLNFNLTDISRPREYIFFFMLNSTEHEIIMLINVKMPATIVGILISISTINVTSESLKATVFTCHSIYEQLKFHDKFS